jgi:hypothetical protein
VHLDVREHWMSGYEETKRTLKHKKKRSGCRCLCTALASWFTTSIAMRGLLVAVGSDGDDLRRAPPQAPPARHNPIL